MLHVYTANTLLAMSAGWFRRPSQSQNGPSITLLRQYVRPQATQARVLFIARVAHREPYSALSRQNQRKHSIGELYPRTWYKARRYTYTVCAMTWADHAITVLAEHDTKSAAIADLKTLAPSSPYCGLHLAFRRDATIYDVVIAKQERQMAYVGIDYDMTLAEKRRLMVHECTLNGNSTMKRKIIPSVPATQSEVLLTAVPVLPHHCGSWVVVERSTGEAVLETFRRATAERINAERYEVLTALDYLGRLNLKLRETV